MILHKLLLITGIALQIYLLFFGFYYFYIGLFGIGKAPRRKKCKPKNRFLILIPAHNEEKVIGPLVKNLRCLDYPKKLYDIVVIADNCTDKTKNVCEKLGAIVLEHKSKPGEIKGKPYAIRYALNVISDYDTKYDAVCIFDADNLVSLNYLEEMNNHLIAGDKLIQCYLDVKNPTDNLVSMSYANAYYYTNRSWQMAKEKLGLGVAIGGTGFCVATDILKKIGWTATSLTEDLEFQMQCLLINIPAHWCHYAKIFDEKPTNFIASLIQRLRWARGHWNVCFKYAPKLFLKGIKEFNILAIDGAIYLLNPFNTILGLVGIIYIPLIKEVNLIPDTVWILLLVMQFLYMIYSILMDTDKPFKKILGLLTVFLYSYSFLPLYIWALITKDNKNWNCTKHTRSLQFNQLHS